MKELKEKGNKCLNEKNYAEAMLHYTHAIKVSPKEYQLYSNRSLAFLKLHQYYYAYEDAKETIRLNPTWPKVILFKTSFPFYYFLISGILSKSRSRKRNWSLQRSY